MRLRRVIALGVEAARLAASGWRQLGVAKVGKPASWSPGRVPGDGEI
jgi:hypothetical protein